MSEYLSHNRFKLTPILEYIYITPNFRALLYLSMSAQPSIRAGRVAGAISFFSLAAANSVLDLTAAFYIWGPAVAERRDGAQIALSNFTHLERTCLLTTTTATYVQEGSKT